MKYLIIALAWGLAAPAFAEDTFQSVMDCMRANVPATLRMQDITLTNTLSTGDERTLKGRLYAKREDGKVRVMMRLTAPSELAGAAYLVRETGTAHQDEMYVYLPAVRRVRHITGTLANGSLLGTDFSYADVKQIQNAFSGVGGKLEAPTQIEQRPVQVISMRPNPKVVSPYTLVRAWVDQKTCTPLKAEFYTGNQTRKLLTAPASALAQSGNTWYLSQIEMEDKQHGTKTVMRIGSVIGDKPLGSLQFDPASFYLAN